MKIKVNCEIRGFVVIFGDVWYGFIKVFSIIVCYISYIDNEREVCCIYIGMYFYIWNVCM